MNVLEILKEEARKVAKNKDNIYCNRHKGVLYEILYDFDDELVRCFKRRSI